MPPNKTSWSWDCWGLGGRILNAIRREAELVRRWARRQPEHFGELVEISGALHPLGAPVGSKSQAKDGRVGRIATEIENDRRIGPESEVADDKPLFRNDLIQGPEPLPKISCATGIAQVRDGWKRGRLKTN